MNHPRPELLSALLDGELRGWQRWRVRRHLRACPECAADYQRLQQVRNLLHDHPIVHTMSDPEDVFWAKVKTEIQRRASACVELPAPRLHWRDWLWLHQPELAVAAAAAVLVLTLAAGWLVTLRRSATVVAQQTTPQQPAGHIIPMQPPPPVMVKVESATTTLPHTVATVVEQSDPQVTVVWISGLPWTADMTEMKTLYGNWDS